MGGGGQNPPDAPVPDLFCLILLNGAHGNPITSKSVGASAAEWPRLQHLLWILQKPLLSVTSAMSEK